MLINMRFGVGLRNARQEMGKTASEMANHARVSVPYVSEIEREKKLPSEEVMRRLVSFVKEGRREKLVDLWTAERFSGELGNSNVSDSLRRILDVANG